MKKLQLGLVVEGNFTNSAVLALPHVREDLGPVKSAALRVARRLSNLLQGGYAVKDYEDLQAAKVILLKIPDSGVERIVGELCESELAFQELSFLLCESWLSIEHLRLLRERGASVASLVGIPCRNRNWFAVEGQASAVRQSKRILERVGGAKVLELQPGAKGLLFAAELATLALPVPYFAGAQQALRESGVAGNHLTFLLEEFGLEMLRSFLRSTRRAWGGPLTECSPDIAAGYLGTVAEQYPELADIVRDQLRWAEERMTGNKFRKNRTRSALPQE